MLANLNFSNLKAYALIFIFALFLYLPGISTIPPIDRDETQYGQVTKQMLESRDFFKPQFLDNLFNTKPIGMYWAQALSVSLLSRNDFNQIWAYRLPSCFALLIGSLLFYKLNKDIFGEKISLLAAIIFESCFWSVVEAHQAQADALLMLCTIITQSLACRIYCNFPSNKLLMWIFLALGILFKGPVLPAVFFSTIFALSFYKKDYFLLIRFRPLIGFVVILTLTAPFLLIYYQQTGIFFAKESFFLDVFPRLTRVVESHGGYPGYYLFSLFFTFWPWSIFLAASIYSIWLERKKSEYLFLICWILPSWFCLELIPTKLPNYIYPIFIPISLGVSNYIINDRPNNLIITLNKIIYCLLSLFLAYWFFNFEIRYGNKVSLLSYLLFFIFLLGIARIIFIQKNILYSIIGMIAVFPVFLAGILPYVENFHLTPKFINSYRELNSINPKNLIFTGYREPSLAFLIGKEIRLRAKLEDATSEFQANTQNILVVNDIEKDNFLKLVNNNARLNFEVQGFDYTHWRWATLYVFSH